MAAIVAGALWKGVGFRVSLVCSRVAQENFRPTPPISTHSQGSLFLPTSPVQVGTGDLTCLQALRRYHSTRYLLSLFWNLQSALYPGLEPMLHLIEHTLLSFIL